MNEPIAYIHYQGRMVIADDWKAMLEAGRIGCEDAGDWTPLYKQSSAQPSGSIVNLILDELFQTGFGDRAKVLQLLDAEGRDLGGRNRASVRSLLLKHISN